MTKPISSALIVDQLYIDIKNRILCGELAPDAKLSVRVMCEYYQVSDTPLKQALNRLVSDQLVVSYPRRGMRVKRFSQNEVIEAIQARFMIELYAVDAAIKKSLCDKDFIKRLEDNLNEDAMLVNTIDDMNIYSESVQREMDVSRNFHVIFISALENDTITGIYNNLQNHRYLYYKLGIDKNQQARISIKEHSAILEALKAGDRNGVENAIRIHLDARKSIVSELAG